MAVCGRFKGDESSRQWMAIDGRVGEGEKMGSEQREIVARWLG